MEEGLKGPDKVLAQDKPELVKGTVDTFAEALRSGIAGANHEARLYTQPWGFRLQDIPITVYLWHGDQDYNVPISVGHYVADAIPDCNATFINNEGHLSLINKYVKEYLSVLIE
jgi:pimeloyl-ACP methyl ester carboxylesterase